jgi:hypothetical protein
MSVGRPRGPSFPFVYHIERIERIEEKQEGEEEEDVHVQVWSGRSGQTNGVEIITSYGIMNSSTVV